MAEDTYSFEQARVRLEEIAAQARKKDTSLERSLDLLEEGVRLANLCTEQIDQTQWKAVLAEAEAERAEAQAADEDEEREPGDEGAEAAESAEHEAADEECAGDGGGEGGAGAMAADEDVADEYSGAASEEPPAGEEPDVEA